MSDCFLAKAGLFSDCVLCFSQVKHHLKSLCLFIYGQIASLYILQKHYRCLLFFVHIRNNAGNSFKSRHACCCQSSVSDYGQILSRFLWVGHNS
nr:MAG TPA: hypothetical protein [Caudoviricetes sp.]